MGFTIGSRVQRLGSYLSGSKGKQFFPCGLSVNFRAEALPGKQGEAHGSQALTGERIDPLPLLNRETVILSEYSRWRAVERASSAVFPHM